MRGLNFKIFATNNMSQSAFSYQLVLSPIVYKFQLTEAKKGQKYNFYGKIEIFVFSDYLEISSKVYPQLLWNWF